MKSPPYQIIDFPKDNLDYIEQAARILMEAFKIHWSSAWPTMPSAREEVEEALNDSEKLVRIAISEQKQLLGWIGAIRQYRGKSWEIHPLAVHPDFQGQGIGSALIRDLESEVLKRGGLSLYAGSDDEDQMTSLSQVELYPEVLKHLSQIKNLKGHPYEFYLKLGFTIVGCLPDANGPGKPDIYLAKKLVNYKV